MRGGDLYDVVVVGCGPVGAAAANLFGAAGLRTLVLEAAGPPALEPRAIHFDFEIMRILQSIGVAEDLAPNLGTPDGSVQIGADGGLIRHLRMGGDPTQLGWNSSYMFYQPELEAALRTRLEHRANVDLRLETQVDTLAAEGGSVTVRATDLAGGAALSFRARYALACDGASSPTRKTLGITLKSYEFEEPWIVIDANVEGDLTYPGYRGMPPGVDLRRNSLMICDPARPATVIPGRRGHRRWEFMLLPGESDAAMSRPEAIAELLEPWTRSARVEVVRSAVYRFRGLVATAWRKGRIFLGGDAAHQSPPFYGQGLGHGIRDAANLAWKLGLVVSGRAPDELLDTYEAERRPQVESVIAASIASGRYICTLDAEAAQARDLRMRAEMARGPLEVFSVIPPLSGGLQPAPGERFIQPLVRRGAEDVRLDDVTGGGFVLLSGAAAPLARFTDDLKRFWRGIGGRSFSLDPHPTDGSEALGDACGHLARWLAARGASGAIIRPDFYVHSLFLDDGEVDAVAALCSVLGWTGDGASRTASAHQAS
jgi:3-(3-hydroxy-phenyl)propionate hydroxylase